MRKQFRLKDNHPLHQRLERVFQAFDKEGIQLSFQRDGTVDVYDKLSKETFEMKDSDDGGQVGHLPPVFEYKLTYEKDVKE